ISGINQCELGAIDSEDMWQTTIQGTPIRFDSLLYPGAGSAASGIEREVSVLETNRREGRPPSKPSRARLPDGFGRRPQSSILNAGRGGRPSQAVNRIVRRHESGKGRVTRAFCCERKSGCWPLG